MRQTRKVASEIRNEESLCEILPMLPFCCICFARRVLHSTFETIRNLRKVCRATNPIISKEFALSLQTAVSAGPADMTLRRGASTEGH